MIQKIIRYMQGYVKIRIKGYSPERFLNLCRYHKIYIWGLTPCDNAYEMYVSLKGFRSLKPLVRKTHTKVVLVKRYGLPFLIHKYRKRKLFLFSFLLCAVLLWLYSSFIWDIHFEGNEKWTDQTLLEFLASTNVSPGMPKRRVDCARIVKEIRKEYDDIVWVSASIDGSRLCIQIKENEDTFHDTVAESGEENNAADEEQESSENKQEDSAPKDLIATQDGVITSIITRCGVPLVHVGDTVKKGQILVSGRIEVLNDAAEVIGYQYQQSDADIYADTELYYEDSVPVTYPEKHYEKKKQRGCLQMQIGSLRFTIGIVKHPAQQWEQYTTWHQMKLGENFYLPVSYGIIWSKSYTTTTKRYEKEALQKHLSQNFSYFSKELEEKGIQIRKNSVKIHLSTDFAVAKGTLFLNQQITEPADTEILVIERNEQNESIGTDD